MMDIFDNISLVLGTQKSTLLEVTNFTFMNSPVVFVSFDEFNNHIFGINLVFSFPDKKKIITKLIENIGYPKEKTLDDWQIERKVKSDFSETIVEKKKYKEIERVFETGNLINLDIIKWEYNNICITALNYSLIRGFSGDYSYLNISNKK